MQGVGHDTAAQMAEWDPYDPTHSHRSLSRNGCLAWMFGVDVKDEFDIVIGNPPYVRANGQDKISRAVIMAQNGYETLREKWDLYIPFVEFGYKSLRPDGVSTMIVADAFCHAKYAIKPQDWYLRNAIIRRLDFLRDIKVFEAGVNNVVYFFQKPSEGLESVLKNIPERRLHVEVFGKVKDLPAEVQKDSDHRAFFPEDAKESLFNSETVLLGEICYISVGMAANAHEVLAPGAFKLNDLLSPIKDKNHPKPFVEAKDLS